MRISQRKNIWVLENRRCRFEVDGRTGCLSGLFVRGDSKDVGLWGGKAGGLCIRDGLRERTYCNLPGSPDRATVAGVEVSRTGGAAKLAFEISFRGALFGARVEFRLGEEDLVWRVSLTGRGAVTRTAAVRFLFPWPATMFPYSRDWRLWAANHRFPRDVYDFNEMQLEYGGADGGIMIPAVTLYNGVENFGLTMLKPLTQRSSRLRFKFDRREPRYEVEYDWLKLQKGLESSVELRLFFHEGDWRPGLGRIYENYREYFDPPRKKIYSLDGPMLGGRVYLDEKTIKDFRKKAGVVWEEIYSHFPCFGDYFSDTEPWLPGRTGKKDPLTYADVNDHIRALHANKVAGLLYWQATGDCKTEFAAAKFPESIIKQEDGAPVAFESYGVYHMNGDESLPFGQHLVEQARKLLEKFPSVDGLFVDQCCYGWIDFGHHDGITMVGNRPAYDILFNYYRNLEKVSRLADERGKVLVGNGPYNVEVQHHLDGIMAETSQRSIGQMQYYGLTKPIVYLIYGASRDEIERGLQTCVQYAVQPGIFCFPKAEYADLYRKYMPLIRLFKHRRWVFESRALVLPDGIDGNIFKLRDGRYAVTMVSRRRSVREESREGGRVPVRVRLSGEKISRAELLPVSGRLRRLAVTTTDGGDVLIETPYDSPAAVIILRVGASRRGGRA